MSNDLKLEITTADLKNLDLILKVLRAQNPDLEIEVESIEETDPPAAS